MTSREACEALSIKPASLYAYASRGLLTSVPGPAGSRARRYLREEVLRLKARHDARTGHAPVAAGALRWGEPVLDSAITEITDLGPRYRGRLATELAKDGVPFESAAELLWTGALPAETRWPDHGGELPRAVVRLVEDAPASPLHRVPLLLAALAAVDRARFTPALDRGLSARPAELARARAIVASMPTIVLAEAGAADLPPESTVARRLARRARARPTRAIAAAFDAALVLSMDHELNVSAFAARVTASAGSDLYACLIAAACALSGPRHGGACERVELLLDEVETSGSAERVLEARAARGEPIPGLGHPLYPAGDPRGRALLERARTVDARRPRTRAAEDVARAARKLFALEPTIDLGLVAVAESCRARRGTASAVFAVGRAAGWVAHVLEQRESPHLLRPRARYVGQPGALSR
jgi:citrate synthase